jgi:hypothetical protein
MGDLYDKFRITELDWSANSFWSEKSVKILAENILSNCVKKMNWSTSMVAEISTLVKLIYIIDAFNKRIDFIKLQMRKCILFFTIISNIYSNIRIK